MKYNFAFIAVFLLVAACEGQHEGHSPAAVQIAPSAEILAISMPSQPEIVCNKDAMYNVTSKLHSCRYALYQREPADDECCAALAAAYGPTSTAPTANCFCDEDYWKMMKDLSEHNRIKWDSVFKHCTKSGFEVYYIDADKNKCTGLITAEEKAEEKKIQEEEEAAAAAEAEPIQPMRSYGAWMRDLNEDVWGTVSFTFAMISLVGFAVMSWSFIFDVYQDLAEGIISKRSKNS
ncbi:hypothetical protein NADE_003101 [Nannochloris sp. 'desiccata']|nr:hypothetical protein KSW81_000844 [Chlorella desiccata (nom. nud.)]KAH7620480.1 hypothetical protein NADE_003101 [Chlorella desiccata (nom. nud.)]